MEKSVKEISEDSVVSKIENKIKLHQETLNKKISYLKNIEEAIKKLNSDKEVAIAEIHTLQGVIHGHSEGLALAKDFIESEIK